jgi:hypothetical protein
MTRSEIKQAIKEIVESVQGLKATELAAKEELNVLLKEKETVAGVECEFDLPELLEEMVVEGMILEVEYVLPSLPHMKSFYLPAGTRINSLRFSKKYHWIDFP